MTDDPKGSYEKPDGFAILHVNKDKAYGMDGYYALGPYPPIEPLVEFIKQHIECACETRIIPVYFPAGARMVMVVDGADMVAGAVTVLGGPMPGSEANN